MPATTKTATPAKEKDRRKSGGKPSLLTTLRVSPNRLRQLLDPSSLKAETPTKESPATSATLPTETAAAASNGDNASESNPGTPAPAGTPSQGPMGPPADGPKKKGVKRGAAALNGEPKIRGKPGPKKKPRLEDGTIDPTARTGAGTYHKLGPKANQGAINAGLRALDRSGKPCRKWAKGGFRLKSFTGVLWEIPRWTAPPKPLPVDSTQESSAASAESSNKENKEGSQVKSENSASASAADAEQRSLPPSLPAASSPAPTPVAAAS
ncbi:hypothetical protein JX265_002896 [Neoarthrinium moseri]|uniref:DUF1711 domain-containing protein n=1 Tax=Neoarthrinium moseri TaxID=1658444 RepID=A0A9P9WT92_9PEZI|nr:uncharacterized protein JN550_008091 [Neoarthrinium moseri]KAI1851057.1 hypothetical protein JX266_003722 [Neoarthrinium moseri]KAI1865833.1 hypothetical protein JN550_008091 [Neoarthrinium moseri]KAI1878719.1 hypothetical protein JX265_002896 [Neoarthrinium moseri]